MRRKILHLYKMVPYKNSVRNLGISPLLFVVFKIGVTKYANAQGLSFGWQPRFHDHIIRDITEMNVIASYIENNVGRWKEDCYNNPITANASANTDFQQYF